MAFVLEDDRHRLDVVDEGSRRGWSAVAPRSPPHAGSKDDEAHGRHLAVAIPG